MSYPVQQAHRSPIRLTNRVFDQLLRKHHDLKSILEPTVEVITLATGTGDLVIKTPYDKDFATGVKELRGEWNASWNQWHVTPSKQNELMKLLNRVFGYELERALLRISITGYDGTVYNKEFKNIQLSDAETLRDKLPNGCEVEILKTYSVAKWDGKTSPTITYGEAI